MPSPGRSAITWSRSKRPPRSRATWIVGIDDLNIVLSNWNLAVPPGDPLADPSGDGFVGIDDLNVVLGNWNAGTPPVAETSGTQEESVAQAQQPPESTPATSQTRQQAATQQSASQSERQAMQRQAPADQNNGLAIANHRSQQRSAFNDTDDNGYTPAFGLWESDDEPPVV